MFGFCFCLSVGGELSSSAPNRWCLNRPTSSAFCGHMNALNTGMQAAESSSSAPIGWLELGVSFTWILSLAAPSSTRVGLRCLSAWLSNHQVFTYVPFIIRISEYDVSFISFNKSDHDHDWQPLQHHVCLPLQHCKSQVVHSFPGDIWQHLDWRFPMVLLYSLFLIICTNISHSVTLENMNQKITFTIRDSARCVCRLQPTSLLLSLHLVVCIHVLLSIRPTWFIMLLAHSICCIICCLSNPLQCWEVRDIQACVVFAWFALFALLKRMGPNDPLTAV